MKKALVVITLAACLLAACDPSKEADSTEATAARSKEVQAMATAYTGPVFAEATQPTAHSSRETEPTVTASDPAEETNELPTEPEDTAPSTTEPTQPSQPPVTEPEGTEPVPTEPTQPKTAVHQHSYSAEVIKATCTAAGYTVHTCPCGDSYTDSQAPATGHAYTETVTKPTMWKQGYTTYTCTGCSDSYTDNYTNISEADKEAFIQEVREATLKYINQFRSEPAESLPGLTQVANYRAVQLHDNFAHSTADLREALAYYQYGEYKTPAGWDPSEYYYDFPGREAISRTSKTGTADEIGKRLAQNFYNSSGHWTYVGSSNYSYIAVGVSYDAASMGGYCWTCCVFVTDTNQYG